VRDQTKQSFERFLSLPDYTAQPNRAHATQQYPRFEIRTVRATPLGDPDESDLAAIVYLSHDNPRIRRANPDLTPEKREGLYTLWFQSNAMSFALLERIPPDANGVSIIGNTAILPLLQKTMDRISQQELAVINLRPEDICGAGETHEVLLLDTWVLHPDYQDSEWLGWLRKRHFGYGNALVLKHISMFWNPGGRQALRLYAEPDAQSMLRLLPRLGFHQHSTTQIGEPLLLLEYPPSGRPSPEDAVKRRYIREVVEKVRVCRSW